MKRFLAVLLLVSLMFAALPMGETHAENSGAALKFGDSGDEVSTVQQRLSDLGYYKGKISGNFLEGTRAAVNRFQRDYGLNETGEVNGETEALLMNAEYRTLRYGIDGEDVKRLQTELITLGYFNAKATGKYRAATQEAVREFQKDNGIDANGEADPETQRILHSGNALPKGAEPTPTPDPELDMGDINDVVMAGDGESTEDTREIKEYSRKLRRGDSGANVKEVQIRLKELGFFDGPISGNYMNKTIEAVKAFQLQNGLNSDGITGQDTWNMLFNDGEVLDSSATPRPTPVPTPVPYAITVDVKNQATIVYARDESGEFTVPVKRMICSTGMVGSPSDVGEWTLSGRKARWAYFSLYGSHAQYWTQINENIAFHSVIYNAVDYKKMSVKSYNKLGSRASHGCVRLLVSDAKWIYDNIEKGVVVTITEDLPRDEELKYSIKQPPLNREYMRPVTTPEPTPEPAYASDGMPPQPFRKLIRGSEGEDVYWLQRKLKELGYYNGTVTGSYYSGTSDAVKAYQRANGLSASGKADVKTLESIYADVLSTPTPEPTTEITPEPTPELTIPPN